MRNAVFVALGLWLVATSAVMAEGSDERSEGAGRAASVGQMEAPMLQAKVARGELPPLEQRIPKEPYVYTMAAEIGFYQPGPLTVAEANVDTPFWPAGEPWGYVRFKRDYSEVEPYLGKGWSWNDDFTELTIYLREGLKWSDGDDYTADDAEFYYNGIQQHPEGFRTPIGNLLRVEKIDTWSFKYVLEQPDPTFLQRIAVNWGPLRAPRHRLEEFHPDYNQIEGMTRAQQWEKLQTEFNWSTHFGDPEWPVLWPWVLHEVRPGIGVRMERNPYYWWVDKEGRQLPYIDEVRSVVARSSEVLALKLLAGEVDEAHRNTNIEMVPVMLDEGSKRGLEVKLYPTEYGSRWAVGFNYMSSDAAKRELFRTAEFRQALSLAINRKLINRVGLLGLGKPTQGYLIPNSPWYTEEVDTAFVEHDPERANQMLDALGLGQRDGEGLRLGPGGEPLSIVYYVAVRGELDVPIAQYVVDGWRAVGVRTLLRTIPQEQLTNAIRTADFDTVQTGLRGSMYPIELFRRGGGGIIPGGAWGLQEEHLYWQSNGRQGRAPDADVAALFALIDEARYGLDEAKRTAAYRRYVEWMTDNIPVIGLAGPSKELLVHKSSLRNVPEDVLVGGGRWDRGSPSWFFEE
jgi:peptide/nickel transport system substrate-binding protein